MHIIITLSLVNNLNNLTWLFDLHGRMMWLILNHRHHGGGLVNCIAHSRIVDHNLFLDSFHDRLLVALNWSHRLIFNNRRMVEIETIMHRFIDESLSNHTLGSTISFSLSISSMLENILKIISALLFLIFNNLLHLHSISHLSLLELLLLAKLGHLLLLRSLLSLSSFGSFLYLTSSQFFFLALRFLTLPLCLISLLLLHSLLSSQLLIPKKFLLLSNEILLPSQFLLSSQFLSLLALNIG